MLVSRVFKLWTEPDELFLTKLHLSPASDLTHYTHNILEWNICCEHFLSIDQWLISPGSIDVILNALKVQKWWLLSCSLISPLLLSQCMLVYKMIDGSLSLLFAFLVKHLLTNVFIQAALEIVFLSDLYVETSRLRDIFSCIRPRFSRRRRSICWPSSSLSTSRPSKWSCQNRKRSRKRKKFKKRFESIPKDWYIK